MGAALTQPVAASAATTRAVRIAALNDAFRRSFTGGRVVVTVGVSDLPDETRAAVLAAVRGFEAFDADNDPHGEHDFGAIEVGVVRACWKIDYYDADLRRSSPDPADPTVTTRVLTVMLPEEW